MKKVLPLLLCGLALVGCSSNKTDTPVETTEPTPEAVVEVVQTPETAPEDVTYSEVELSETETPEAATDTTVETEEPVETETPVETAETSETK